MVSIFPNKIKSIRFQPIFFNNFHDMYYIKKKHVMAQFSDRKFADVFLTKCNSKYYFLTGKLLVQFNSKGQFLKRLSLSLCIHFYWLSWLRLASHRKLIQNSALRLRLRRFKILTRPLLKIPLQALKRKGLSRAFEALKAFSFFCTAAKSVVLNNVWKRVCENFYLTTLQKMFLQ